MNDPADIQNENEVFEVLETTECDLPAEVFDQYDIEPVSSEPNLRYTARLYASWSGVDSCNEYQRVAESLYKVLKGFRKKKIEEHPELEYRTYGLIHPVKNIVRNRRNRWNGARSCYAHSYFYGYVEFRKPTA